MPRAEGSRCVGTGIVGVCGREVMFARCNSRLESFGVGGRRWDGVGLAGSKVLETYATKPDTTFLVIPMNNAGRGSIK